MSGAWSKKLRKALPADNENGQANDDVGKEYANPQRHRERFHEGKEARFLFLWSPDHD